LCASRRRHTRSLCDWSSDVCSSDLTLRPGKLFFLFLFGKEGGCCIITPSRTTFLIILEPAYWLHLLGQRRHSVIFTHVMPMFSFLIWLIITLFPDSLLHLEVFALETLL